MNEIKKNKKTIKETVENFFFKIYASMDKSELLISIKQGFMMIIPIFIIGAIALLLMNFPIDSINKFIASVFDGRLKLFIRYIYDATFGVASLYVVISVSYMYSTNFTNKKTATNIFICLVSLVSYFAFLGINPKVNANGGELHYILFEYLSVNNVFSALITAIASTRIYFFVSDLLNKQRRKKFVVGAEIDFKRASSSILPMAITVCFFGLLSFLIHLITTTSANFNELIITIFQAPFSSLGRNLGTGILIIIFQCIFWFFGIHGGNVLNSVMGNIFSNTSGEIVTKTAIDTFVLMGGSGCAICLLLAILFFSKSKNSRMIAKNASLPMFFNISETLVFGLPIVLNPILLIPFILVPICNMITTYLAISFNLVTPLLAGMANAKEIAWTTPILFNGFLLTNSFAGILLQIFNLTIGVLIYAPFVTMNDRIVKRKFDVVVDEMTKKLLSDSAEGKTTEFMTHSNYISKIAIELSNELRYALEHNKIELYYQPLLNYEEEIISAEALLRWKYNDSSYIFPPLLIAISKEDGTFDVLTKHIIEYVLTQIPQILKQINKNICFSINIQANQLADVNFTNWVIEKVTKANLPFGTIYLELTEETILIDSKELNNIFEKLKKAGIKLAIDDFGMGHTSLNYLKENSFDYVKLDGMLIQKIENNERICEIVKTIIDLGKNLGFQTIAEYVEVENQRELLHKLGCDVYQGYLYSKAIPKDEFIKYCLKTNKK